MLEDRIREHQKSDPKFSFLRDGDAFNRYYRYMIEKVKEDGEEAVLASQSAATASAGAAVQVNGASTPAGVAVGTPVAVQQTVKKENQLEEPKPLEFVAELPNVTALDL
jgi:splicing factor 3A subunit 1